MPNVANPYFRYFYLNSLRLFRAEREVSVSHLASYPDKRMRRVWHGVKLLYELNESNLYINDTDCQ